MASKLRWFNTSERTPEDRAEGARLEGWPQARSVLPSFETVARKCARPPQDDVGVYFAFSHNRDGAICTFHRYGFSSRSASACASFIAASAGFAPVSAACRPSLSALVTRWLSWVESSATANLSWSRATAAAGKPATYSFMAGVSQASGRTAT